MLSHVVFCNKHDAIVLVKSYFNGLNVETKSNYLSQLDFDFVMPKLKAIGAVSTYDAVMQTNPCERFKVGQQRIIQHLSNEYRDSVVKEI